MIAIILLLTALPVFAAKISFEAEAPEIAVGQKFEVEVVLNAGEEELNAVEGKISFPPFLGLQEIRDGNSVINFWIERPRGDKSGEVVFSGIIPGGWKGSNGLLFTMVFLAKEEGLGLLEISSARALKNDGKGSLSHLSLGPLQISVLKSSAAYESDVTPAEDKENPESFIPEIARDQSIFAGKRFLVFAAQDKGSGISHYEVKETRRKFFQVLSPWKRTESPHVLKDQELRSFIFVKAVDRAENKTIVRMNPHDPLAWYENYENWVIIMLGLSAVYAIWKKKISSHS